ncbi:MAG: uroporphyrinogen decarboxylase family protein [Andreesenia angusta]|nr:uroporphyrinogen decarboxylase family protein [Andreesenia angusta]
MKDRMSTEERMSKLIRGEKIDRVPVIPHMGIYAAKICNIPYDRYYLDPNLAYTTQTWALELHQHDGGYGYSIPEGYAQEFGGEIEFSKGFESIVPKVIRRPIEKPSDLDKLSFPKIDEAFASSRILEFNRNKYRDGHGVSITAGSAMSIAVQLVGMDKLMRYTIRDSSFVHALMDFCAEYLIYMAKFYCEEFKDITIGAGAAYPVESSVIIPPKKFEEFSVPYINKVFSAYKDLGINIGSIHLCGDHYDNLPIWRDSIDMPSRMIITTGYEMDLIEITKVLGDNHIMGGNLRNATLESGNYMDVYNEAKKLIDKYKYLPGGYVLTPDCDLTVSCPAANLHSMIKASRDFGSY